MSHAVNGMMGLGGSTGGWLPRAAIARFESMTLGEFESALGETPFLLVRLDGRGASRLALGLSECSGLEAPRPSAAPEAPMQFTTQMAESGEIPLGSASLEGETQESNRLSNIVEYAHYVVQLRKRGSAGAFLDKITVGRTRNHDIVLRDPSVSKFHASIEVIDAQHLLVKDMGSRNHTQVNGDVVDGSKEAVAGDIVVFGSVETTVCSATGLWHILHR